MCFGGTATLSRNDNISVCLGQLACAGRFLCCEEFLPFKVCRRRSEIPANLFFAGQSDILGRMTDTYTKTILTVIACALVYLCVESSISPRIASAQGPLTLGTNEQRVVITGFVVPETYGTGVRRFDGKAGRSVTVTKWQTDNDPTPGGV
jgi:hypothetical protein